MDAIRKTWKWLLGIGAGVLALAAAVVTARWFRRRDPNAVAEDIARADEQREIDAAIKSDADAIRAAGDLLASRNAELAADRARDAAAGGTARELYARHTYRVGRGPVDRKP